MILSKGFCFNFKCSDPVHVRQSKAKFKQCARYTPLFIRKLEAYATLPICTTFRYPGYPSTLRKGRIGSHL